MSQSLLSPENAWQLIETKLETLAPTMVERRLVAGRVLATDVLSTVDLPAHDVSAMDGYAISSEVHADSCFPVTGTVAAGDPPGMTLQPDSAVRIMTGAPVPAAARTVVPVELTDDGYETVRIENAARANRHIRRQGEVVRAGEVVLRKGTRLGPGALSLLASHGHASVSVYRPPSLAFVSTGDEVVPPEVVPGPGQLRDSHSDFLASAAQSLGLDVEHLGIARDTAESLEPLLQRGLQSDVLLVSGGVSMGQFDVVEDVFDSLGCEPLFDAVAVQPGKPLVVATHPGGIVFGLPGNPASVMVSFWLFVRPALRRLMGLADSFWSGALDGTLASSLPGAKGRDRFLPATVSFCDGSILVDPEPPKGSHDLMAYARGDALVRVRAGSSPAAAGDPCQILPLADWPALNVGCDEQ